MTSTLLPPAAPSTRRWADLWHGLEHDRMPASTSVEDYILAAFKCAVGEALDDGTFVATIPELPDIIAYGNDSHECWRRLYGLLEETVRLWLAQGHPLPVLGGIHLDTV